MASGILRKGDEVMVLPSGKRSKVKSIVTYDGELEEAFAPLAVTATLTDEVDVSRGDMLVLPDNPPHVSSEIEAMVVWMVEQPFAIFGHGFAGVWGRAAAGFWAGCAGAEAAGAETAGAGFAGLGGAASGSA